MRPQIPDARPNSDLLYRPNSGRSMTPGDVAVEATLENQQNVENQAPYTDYWNGAHECNKKVNGGRALAHFVVAGSVMVRDIEAPIKLPKDIAPRDKRTPEDLLALWDRALGPFNLMTQGQGDLLRGAGLLLSRNTKKDKDFPTVRRPDPGTVSEAFIDIADQLDMSEQQASASLLLAGQFIHKSAWIEPDKEKQARLFDIAEQAYERIYFDEEFSWGEDKLMAAQLRADIRFHRLSTQIREKAGQKQPSDDFHQLASELLRGQVQDFFEIAKLHVNNPSIGYIGLMLELFTEIAMRDHIYGNPGNRPGKNHPEIRHAFTSEDEPIHPATFCKKSSFDLVIQRYKNASLTGTVPIQIKLGSSGSDQAYQSNIEMHRIYIDLRDMMNAARALEEKYRDDTPKATNTAQDTLKVACKALSLVVGR